MARGRTDLASREYDHYLASNKKEGELRQRNSERRAASKNIVGYHFGIDPRGPIKVDSKEQFRQELSKRGLMMEDDIPNHKRGK